MHALLGTGVPAVQVVGHTPFDWAPFVMVLAGVVVAPLVFGIRLTTRSIPVLVLGGITLGWLSAAIGVLPAVSIGLITLALVSEYRSRARRSGRVLNTSD